MMEKETFKPELTKKEAELFDFIVTSIRRDKAPPSYMTIEKTLGYTKGLVSRRVKSLREKGRLAPDNNSYRSLRILPGNGHDELVSLPYVTSDRQIILESVSKLTKRKGRGPSIYAIAADTGFSTMKVRRHIDYLDQEELVRYSLVLNEVIIIQPGDYGEG